MKKKTLIDFQICINVPSNKAAATFAGKMRQFFGCILDMQPHQYSLLDPRSPGEFSGKMRRFLRSQTDFISPSAFLCCHYIIDSYVICFTLIFFTAYVYFHSH